MRRTILLTVVLVGALLVASATAMAATKTFYSNKRITIPDNGYTVSTINVSGLSGAIKDVDLTIKGLSHTDPSDLRVYLELTKSGGSGGVAPIYFQGGDFAVRNVTFTLDDGASKPLPTPLQNGTYQPYERLDFFDGRSPNGEWTLFVNDHVQGDTGTIGGWSLKITT